MNLPAPLLFIADIDEAGPKLPSILHATLSGGCRWILLRSLKSDAQTLLTAAKQAKNLCADYSAKLFISRDAALARNIKADGLQLPSDAGAHKFKIPGMLLGQSCHSEAELLRAEETGMDYASISPIFATQSKPGYGPALGLANLKVLAQKTKLPVIALGGITPQNAGECLKAGAKAVAVMGGILRASDPKTATINYLRQLKL